MKASGESCVAVAVITYRRPDGLAKLLAALERQVRCPERPFRLIVLVVDNDPAGSAAAVSAHHQASSSFELRYVVEREQGIPFARNRALAEVPADADVVCFIDDDEWPIDTWLDEMLATRARTGADCVYGPVAPVYPIEAPEFFIKSGVFERRRHGSDARIGYAASNNVMISTRFLKEQGLRFEERMRFTGGTDYLFFRQAIRRGLKVHWSSEALVHDVVPADRMTWRWVLRRQYRLGNTFSVSERMEGRLGGRLLCAAYGCARICLGVLTAPALLVSPRRGMRALSHLFRGAGLVAGACGHAYKEYAPGVLSGERAELIRIGFPSARSERSET